MNDVRPSDLRLSDLRLSDLGLSNLRGWYALMVATGLVLVTGCGGGGSKPNVITTSGPNVAAISVNRGPTGNDVNEAFVSVTICVPNTSTCQTIPDVIVDTGSAGLRLTAPLTISLPQQMGSNSHPVAECLPFLSGFSWGPVQTADIKIASETASAVPVQVMSDAAFPVPGACSNMGLQPIDTVAALGANGLLGVGLANQDCGPACAPGTTSNPNLYYECPTTGCVATTEALAQQVANPVATFASDNNGVVIELPAVNGGEATVNGSLVFGIGTQSNNSLGSAQVYTVDEFGNFTTTFKGQTYSSSFLDSGSNGFFFLNSNTSGISDCTDSGFYCPQSPQSLSATNQGANGASGSIKFSIANADSLFSSGNDSAFGDLGGPGLNSFDWGLPFFYGRNVFTVIEGKSTPGGTGPFWAY